MGLDNDCSGVIEEDEEAPPIACWVHHCEDLDGLDGGQMFNLLGRVIGMSVSDTLGVGCTAAALDGWSLTILNPPFTVRFWMSAYDAGYWTVAVPEVSYNGTVVTSDIITGDPQGGDGTDWLQRESGLIPAGSGTVRIEFSAWSPLRTPDRQDWSSLVQPLNSSFFVGEFAGLDVPAFGLEPHFLQGQEDCRR